MKRVILALDVETLDDAKNWIKKTLDYIDIYKIGIPLFVKYRRQITDYINQKNKLVFLDLKLFDIPSVIERTVRFLNKFNIFSLSLHITGGEKMLSCAKNATNKIKLWGVSVLTSFNSNDCKSIYNKNINDVIKRYLNIAKKIGLDGFICSAGEIKLARKIYPQVKIITPGISLSKTKTDQKRVFTPYEAFKEGADFIVIGRSILNSKSPQRIIRKILYE